MDTTLALLVVGLPLAVLAIAAWPLLLLPRMRAALVGAGGTCCVFGGTAIAGLLAAGMLPLPGFTESAAVAQETLNIPKIASPPADAANAGTPIEYVSCAGQNTLADPVVDVAPATPAPTTALPAGVEVVPPAPKAPAAPKSPPPVAPEPPIEVSPPLPGQENEDAKHDDIKIETRPDGTVIIPAGRPDWVQHPRRSRTGDVHQITVSSGPYATELQAERALVEELV
jgi:hypothetical protein